MPVPTVLSAASSSPDQPPSSFAKAVNWIIAATGVIVIAYLMSYRYGRPLWDWTREAPWHWLVGFLFLNFLIVLPFMAGWAVVSFLRTFGQTRGRLRLAQANIVAALGFGALLLCALPPQPSWLAGNAWYYYWAAVVLSAVAVAALRMYMIVRNVGDPIPRDTYAGEWRFNHRNVDAAPDLAIAMSGGGIRSAAFNLGVLRALHDNGTLKDVDVMSAVSGGTYILSWYLLQPFYAAGAAKEAGKPFDLDATFEEMFRDDGRFQSYLRRNPRVMDYGMSIWSMVFDLTYLQISRALGLILGSPALYNQAGFVRKEYREKVQALFQGRPNDGPGGRLENALSSAEWQSLNRAHSNFAVVKPVSYRELGEFAREFGLPFFIFNGTLLVERDKRDDLWPATFEFTADDFGCDALGYHRWSELLDRKIRGREEMQWVEWVNLAPAISGAAIGLANFKLRGGAKEERSSKLRAWTPFLGNIDLGYLLPCILWGEAGQAYVSDGGHSENLGLYALIKRGCKKIIVVDAEHEGTIPYVFQSYTQLKNKLRSEMSLELEVAEIDEYLASAAANGSREKVPDSVMYGEVRSVEESAASPLTYTTIDIVYIKLGIDRDNLGAYPEDVQKYALHHEIFPQDPTTKQVYSSDQFLAYVELGRFVASQIE